MSTAWRPKFTLEAVTVLHEKECYTGYSTVRELQLRLPLFNGGSSEPVMRELIVRPTAVAALLYDPDTDQVVLIEQFRIGASLEAESPWLLEIVAGMIEPGDSPDETALREITEETGCQAEALLPICRYLTTPGIVSEKIHVYCAKVSAPRSGTVHGLMEEGEDIKVHVLKTQDALQLLEEGKIISSPTIIALQWLALNKNTLNFSKSKISA